MLGQDGPSLCGSWKEREELLHIDDLAASAIIFAPQGTNNALEFSCSSRAWTPSSFPFILAPLSLAWPLQFSKGILSSFDLSRMTLDRLKPVVSTTSTNPRKYSFTSGHAHNDWHLLFMAYIWGTLNNDGVIFCIFHIGLYYFSGNDLYQFILRHHLFWPGDFPSQGQTQPGAQLPSRSLHCLSSETLRGAPKRHISWGKRDSDGN